MAKQRNRSQLEDMADSDAALAAAANEAPAPAAPPVAVAPEPPTESRIVLPLVITGNYAQRHLDFTLPPQEAEVLRWLQDGLKAQGQTLADGRPVVSAGLAVRWLLQQAREWKGKAFPETPAG